MVEKFTLDPQRRNALSFLSTGIVQKHEQNDSVVLMWTSRKFHEGGSQSFVGRGWIIITPSAHTSVTQPMTLIRSYYDLSSHASDSAVAYGDVVRSFLVGAMGERLRLKYKMYLKEILTLTGREDRAAAVIV